MGLLNSRKHDGSGFTMKAIPYLNDLVRFKSPSQESNIQVSDYVQNLLNQLDFQTERIEYQDKNDVTKVNIIGKKGTGRGGLAYFGHTDVVPALNWFTSDFGPYDPTQIDDRIYGRGSCDMKGSVACMIAAAEKFQTEELKAPLYITCTADEEVGFIGASEVAEKSELYKEMVENEAFGLIGEPTMLQIVHAHKGIFGFNAVSKGKAAHSSSGEGLNANLAMIPFLVDMKQIHDETLSDEKWLNHDFDPPHINWNIGINDFNQARNITSPQSVCTVYFRPMPGQIPEILYERVVNSAEKHGLSVTLEVKGGPFFTDPESEYVQAMIELAGCEKSITVAYGTDGSIFTKLKNKVVCGPGSILQAHKNDEWISLDQLQKGTDFYSKLIRHFCQ